MPETAVSPHPREPHTPGTSQRLNWLRAGVLGANDGIVSTASLVVGVAGATTDTTAILVAGVAGMVGGAVSMALGEYVSVSSQRDSEKALVTKEQGELADFPPSDSDAQNHSGTLSFPNAFLPGATFTSNKDTDDGEGTRVATGTETYGDWLTADTPFGAAFGPSGPSTTIQFFRQRIGTETVATTTYTFRKPFPANRLGFAVGDIDVDNLTITATDDKGNPVPGSKLAGGVFNYCDVPVDKPTGCDAGPYTNPVWTPGSNGGKVTPTPPAPGIQESSGSSAWFRPTVPLKTLTFVFEAYSGAGDPSYRAWFASFPRTTIATSVETSKKKVKGGKTLKLRVKTRNTGSYTGEDVKTCVKIPRGFVVVKTGGTKVSGRKACWTKDSLAAGEETEKHITVGALVTTRGRFSFPGTATSSNAGKDSSSDFTRVVGQGKKRQRKPEPVTG